MPQQDRMREYVWSRDRDLIGVEQGRDTTERCKRFASEGLDDEVVLPPSVIVHRSADKKRTESHKGDEDSQVQCSARRDSRVPSVVELLQLMVSVHRFGLVESKQLPHRQHHSSDSY